MADSKIILPKQLSLQILCKIYCASHMICQMQDFLRHSETKFENGNQVREDLVNSCQACQVTNAISNPPNPGTWLQGKKPGAYWEADLTEVKPGKFDYRYLLVFIDTLSGWTNIFPTRHDCRDSSQEIAGRYTTQVWIPHGHYIVHTDPRVQGR